MLLFEFSLETPLYRERLQLLTNRPKCAVSRRSDGANSQPLITASPFLLLPQTYVIQVLESLSIGLVGIICLIKLRLHEDRLGVTNIKTAIRITHIF